MHTKARLARPSRCRNQRCRGRRYERRYRAVCQIGCGSPVRGDKDCGWRSLTPTAWRGAAPRAARWLAELPTACSGAVCSEPRYRCMSSLAQAMAYHRHGICVPEPLPLLRERADEDVVVGEPADPAQLGDREATADACAARAELARGSGALGGHGRVRLVERAEDRLERLVAGDLLIELDLVVAGVLRPGDRRRRLVEPVLSLALPACGGETRCYLLDPAASLYKPRGENRLPLTLADGLLTAELPAGCP